MQGEGLYNIKFD